MFHGEISHLDNQVDPITRTISVRALIDNTDHTLKSGLLMQVTLETNVRQSLVLADDLFRHRRFLPRRRSRCTSEEA